MDLTLETMPPEVSETIPTVEVVTPIKLSEAYRLGRMMAPRWANHTYYDGKAACAYGAMGLGLGYLTMGVADEVYLDPPDDGNSLPAKVRSHAQDVFVAYKCKCFGPYDKDSITDVIEHYSDTHRNTFGRNKDIIELLESVGL